MAASVNHPRDAEAAEYVIGTLPLNERLAFERDMALDASLVQVVRSWEDLLAPLSEALPTVEPSASTWQAIHTAIGVRAVDAPDRRASAAPSTSGQVIAWPVSSELKRLRRSRGMWRAATMAVGALAASLAVFVAYDGLWPEPAQERLVAVVNRSGELPALIVRVDPRAGLVHVRAVAAETPPDHSLELWSIVGTGAPRSLGLVSSGQGRRPIPAADRGHLQGATLAVSVEPPGGSKTGGPTGPVVYQGKLVPDVD